MVDMPHPTLLRYSSWWRGRLIPSEYVLPLPAPHYEVIQVGHWIVRVQATSEVIYQGIGPVDVVTSSAPF